MDEKKYLLDDKPVSALELINRASKLDMDLRSVGLVMTNGAANILRRAGYMVGYNPDYIEKK